MWRVLIPAVFRIFPFFGYLINHPPKMFKSSIIFHLVHQNILLSILYCLRFHGQKPIMTFTNLNSDLVLALLNFISIDLILIAHYGEIKLSEELNFLGSYLAYCQWFLYCTHSRLHSLRSLSLHNNLLTYLPREILNLIHLEELSLRGNPLVVRFVRDLTYDPPTLLELAARTIKIRNISYTPCDLPGNLLRYLSLASNCPNPKCGGKLI